MTRLEAINNRISSLEQLQSMKEIWSVQGKKVVFTNGCFDLMHRGHYIYLAEAADFGDVLVVGLNSDRSVKNLKGEHRPIHNEADRAFQLAALSFVDFVVVFDEETPIDLITALEPDVLVKGGDYDPKETDSDSSRYIVGSKEQASRGKETVAIDFVEGYSTSSIIDKIKE